MPPGNESLKQLYDSLQVVCDQLKDREMPYKEAEHFDREKFWKEFTTMAKMVSHEASKLCLALGQSPLPPAQERAALVADLEKACLALLSVFMRLPRSEGNTLRAELADRTWEIFRAVQTLLKVFFTESSTHLQAVGTVWEKCNAIEHASKDNKEAVSSILNGQYGIVQDATEELDTSINVDDEEAEGGDRIPVRNGFIQPRRSSWLTQERQLLSPGLGLIKTARNTLHKVATAVASRGRCNSQENNDQLDMMADLVRTSGANVDEFVMSLYPPIFIVAVEENAKALQKHILSILDATRQSHFYDTSEEWATFLDSVANHNYQNLMECTRRTSAIAE